MRTYQYIGDGAGIPGMPHVITDEDAERDGLTDLLNGAIANGSYVAVETDPTPDPFPKGKGRKKESEVNDG